MPAGKTKDETQPEPPESPNPDGKEIPAVGESVTFMVFDPDIGTHLQQAALITGLMGDGFNVDLTVFAQHARAGRPYSNVPWGPLPEDQAEKNYWKYPEATF